MRLLKKISDSGYWKFCNLSHIKEFHTKPWAMIKAAKSGSESVISVKAIYNIVQKFLLGIWPNYRWSPKWQTSMGESYN